MQTDGPLCGCGGHGCLEALASRTAIERDIRQGIAAGRKTVLAESVSDGSGVIRSNVLRRALEVKDELVQEVMTRAAQVLGLACLQIRQLLDPEVIVLGGGLIEACKSHILPIVLEVMATDGMAKARSGGKVVVSSLGDDAGVLGAVALAQQYLGHDPLEKVRSAVRRHPTIAEVGDDSITVDSVTYDRDIYIRVDGKVGKRTKSHGEANSDAPAVVEPADLKRVCKGDPSILIIGTGGNGTVVLSDDAEEFLRKRGIVYEPLPNREAADAYNVIRGRKAALIHLGG
jgi:glucokinase